MSKMEIIGITGGIGSGKSYIAAQMAESGYRVYDTDKEAKRLIVEDPELRAGIVALLGAEVYEGDVYCTDIVAKRVFANPALLKQLNALVHPFVERDIKNLSASETSGPSAQRSFSDSGPSAQRSFSDSGPSAQRSFSAAVLQRSGLLIESALLIESGLYRLCDRVIVVTAPEAVRIARTMARDHCTESQVRDRIAVQMPEKERLSYADFVINNNN